MSRPVFFDTSIYCQICNTRGAFDFMGDYLCEKCYREDIERDEYDDEINDEFYCKCDDCKCGKE